MPDCLPKVKISRDGRRPDWIFAGAVCDTTALERLVSEWLDDAKEDPK